MSRNDQSRLGESHIAPVSKAVVEAVAAAKDVDPLSIQPLYEVVDPDALDLLFASPSSETIRSGGHVEFTIEDCTVRITVTQDDVDVEVTDCGRTT
ncbi:HalOD1 output domain-containing protein [Haloferax sp. YSMS24]|uniref:HalOD1 output domain-containing protein n=1 Tax=unclassified Haloferax TaxID=2625095 RepID=UPI00398D2394